MIKEEDCISMREEWSTLKEEYIYFCTKCNKQMYGVHRNYCDNCGQAIVNL